MTGLETPSARGDAHGGAAAERRHLLLGLPIDCLDTLAEIGAMLWDDGHLSIQQTGRPVRIGPGGRGDDDRTGPGRGIFKCGVQ